MDEPRGIRILSHELIPLKRERLIAARSRWLPHFERYHPADSLTGGGGGTGK